LDDQASALGLPRSTTWTILHTKHKNSGLAASVIKQILAQPRLPSLVRRKVLEYVEQKSAGAYGHNPYGHQVSPLPSLDSVVMPGHRLRFPPEHTRPSIGQSRLSSVAHDVSESADEAPPPGGSDALVENQNH